MSFYNNRRKCPLEQVKDEASRRTENCGWLFVLSGGKDGDHEGLSADGADGKTDPVVDCFGGIIGDGEKLLAN